MADGVQLLREGEEHFQQIYFTNPADRVVDTWPFMSSPVPVLSIVLSYIAFVFYFGPRFMEHRKPFNLRYVLIAYNLINVLISSYLVLQVIGNVKNMQYLYNNMFNPMDRRKAPYVYEMNACAWLYTVSKIIELADTVFFILRKKQNQVSFLHVYHHSNMVLTTWVYLKYIRGEQGVVMAFINSFVHVVMYSYYLLAAFGPRVQKYLWWKKYITKLQIGQFVVALLYLAALLIYDCRFPKGFTYFCCVQGTIFLALFINFYRKAYTKKEDASKLKES